MGRWPTKKHTILYREKARDLRDEHNLKLINKIMDLQSKITLFKSEVVKMEREKAELFGKIRLEREEDD